MIRSVQYLSVFMASGLLALFLAGCGESNSTSTPSEVVAIVDNQILTQQDLTQQLMQTPGVVDTLSFYKSAQKSWVEREMVLAHARSIGLDKTPRYQSRQEELQVQLLEDEFAIYLEQYHDSNVEVTQEEVQEFYLQNRDRFQFEEPWFRIRHVTTSSYQDALDARSDLLGGRPWQEIAQQYSLDPQARIQQSEQVRPLSQWFSDLPQLQSLLSVLGVTEVSDVYRIAGRWHFIQISSRLEAGDVPDSDWSRQWIASWLRQQKKDALNQAYMRNLLGEFESAGRVEIKPIPK
ncbi:MAG: peptidyl-prolyl cis-trans isomerase [Balneolaceae bacterium]|nr:peptidyl-prolyl cis-trans isomerase [Balneolaceae bacterium]